MSNSNLVLGLDADGVLLNYLAGLFAFVASEGHEVACEPHEVDMWDCRKAFPSWSDDRIMQAIQDFSIAPSFAEIPVMDGAVEAIHFIKSAVEGLQVVAITSAGVSDDTINLRRKNLEVFPFDDVHVLPLGASKEEHLSRLPAGSLFVDDLYKHVVSAERAGCRGILFRQHYNIADNHPNVISNWTEGKDVILDLLSKPFVLAA